MISCRRCGDSPLVTGTDSGTDEVPTQASMERLQQQPDWKATPGRLLRHRFSGNQEDHSAADHDGVVAEAFVEAAQ